jgi:hypothetical protein
MQTVNNTETKWPSGSVQRSFDRQQTRRTIMQLQLKLQLDHLRHAQALRSPSYAMHRDLEMWSQPPLRTWQVTRLLSHLNHALSHETCDLHASSIASSLGLSLERVLSLLYSMLATPELPPHSHGPQRKRPRGNSISSTDSDSCTTHDAAPPPTVP